jgi:hypothetical protein
LNIETTLDPGLEPELPPSLLRTVVKRTTWTIVGAVLLATTLVAAGTGRLARLTLNWVDNSGGVAKFIIERRTGTSGTYAPIATTGTGITTYTDAAIVAGTTYCYRIKASNASAESGYSNEACASDATRFDQRR